MRFTFQLAQLLGLDPEHHRGIIKQICDHTELERHQVANLLRGQVQYLSLKTLAILCDYLVDYHDVDPQLLPGALFGRQPEDFWALLAERGHLELCLGMRRFAEWPEHRWVTDSDAFLHGTLVRSILNVGDAGEQAVKRPPLQSFDQRLVTAPGPFVPDRQVQQEAKALFRDFGSHKKDAALIGLGSVKINAVVELILAHTFRARPFQSQDNVRKPQVRQCPILFRYREEDPQPASCCSGMRLAQGKDADQPGIYYEEADGTWVCCPWDEHSQDAALVFYSYWPLVERLEMVLGGFSGRATRCLAAALRDLTPQFWPPCYATPELQIGAFVVCFGFDAAANDADHPGKGKPTSIKVLPLSEGALKRRLKTA